MMVRMSVPKCVCQVELDVFPEDVRLVADEQRHHQFTDKIVNGGAAYARNSEVDQEIGGVWRHMYERYRRGGLNSVYDAECRSETQLVRGLASGELVRDTRLVEALEGREM
jgi:hypothetical protein